MFQILLILLLLPCNSYAMLEECNQDIPDLASSSSNHSSQADLDEILSMDAASDIATTHSEASDSYSSLAEFLGVSKPAYARSMFAGACRHFAKKAGYLDTSGINASETEKERTMRILQRYKDMLQAGNEIDTALEKQYLDRQKTATEKALRLLKTLQAYNLGEREVSKILIKIERTQKLLDIHEHTTLNEPTIAALKMALQLAREKTRDRLNHSEINSGT